MSPFQVPFVQGKELIGWTFVELRGKLQNYKN
jgi:hypothetical protein